MKTRYFNPLTLTITLLALAFASCPDPGSSHSGASTTRLVLDFGTGGLTRTAIPDWDGAFDTITVTLIGNGEPLTETAAWPLTGEIAFDELVEGTYTLTVTGFLNETLRATFTQEITLDPGELEEVPVTFVLTENTGDLSLALSFPDLLGINSVNDISVVLSRFDNQQQPSSYSISLGPDPEEADTTRLGLAAGNLAPGAYILTVVFNSGNQTLLTLREAVNVAAGLTTRLWVTSSGGTSDVLELNTDDFFSTDTSLSAVYCSAAPGGVVAFDSRNEVDFGIVAAESLTFTAVGNTPGQTLSYQYDNAGAGSFLGLLISGQQTTLMLPGNTFSTNLRITVTSPAGNTDTYIISLIRGVRIRYFGNGNTAGSVPPETLQGYGTNHTIATVDNDVFYRQSGPVRMRLTGWKENQGEDYTPGTTHYTTANLDLYAQWSVIGGRGPGGGYVFYDKGYVSDGWRYLEVAPDDGTPDGPGTGVVVMPWSDDANTMIGTSTGIGTGKRNSQLIMYKIVSDASVAKICDNFVINGRRDWFLPSADEMVMISNNGVINQCGFNWDYWSSTENTATGVQVFYAYPPNNDGAIVIDYIRSKVGNNGVAGNGAQYRPVRAFRSNAETWLVTYVSFSGFVTPPVDNYHYETGEEPVVRQPSSVSGAVFLGWNTAADGSGDRYSPGVNLPAMTDNVVLYAEWAVGTAIYDATQLSNWNRSDSVVLMADIDLNNQEWSPIGNANNPFTGLFHGNGHTISNFKITGNGDYQGFFGYIGGGGAVVTLHLDSGASGLITNTGSYTGGLAGFNLGQIMGCSYSGKVNVSGSGGYAGGLVGYNGGDISNSFSTAEVNGSSAGQFVGGLVGNSGELALSEIRYCWASGKVTGYEHVGGLIGGNRGIVEECYAVGAVTASSLYAGGLAGSHMPNLGSNSFIIQNSYARGDVSGGSSGGLIGLIQSPVKYCFSTGIVNDTVNSLIGLLNITNSTTSCYYLSSDIIVGDESFGHPRLDSDMKVQGTYMGWNFNSDGPWTMLDNQNNGYPCLRYFGVNTVEP
jgi:hypothetical protein